ncbi:MAG: ABC transporter permease [Gemmatimonadota bacterium]|nr:ABC transporter permease [Gemmatimonadota bacterium]
MIDASTGGAKTFILQRLPSLAGVRFAAATAVAIVLLSVLLLEAGGYDSSLALRAWWNGSLGSSYALTSATLVRATPLIVTGLAVALAFQAGVFNIGAEGQLLTGAAIGAVIGVKLSAALGVLTLPAELVAGAMAGAFWAGIAAWLRSRFGVLEVISTIMLNFVALHAVGFLVRGPLQEPLAIYPQSDALPRVAQLPKLIPGTRLHWGLLVAVAAAVLLWWVLRHTAAGFRLRAGGANPDAARSAGLIDVGRVTATAFLVSGALAGLAGAVELTGVTFALYENISPGYGYTAIAVALLARLDPLAVVGAGFFFGALEAGAGAMQRDAGVPAAFVSVVEAGIVLAVIAFDRVRDKRDNRGGIS